MRMESAAPVTSDQATFGRAAMADARQTPMGAGVQDQIGADRRKLTADRAT